jgi:hypothetical protein
VSQISGDGSPDSINVDFFMKEEERARSESSYTLLPELVMPVPLSDY